MGAWIEILSSLSKKTDKPIQQIDPESIAQGSVEIQLSVVINIISQNTEIKTDFSLVTVTMPVTSLMNFSWNTLNKSKPSNLHCWGFYFANSKSYAE